jgi:serine/threonine protein kinase
MNDMQSTLCTGQLIRGQYTVIGLLGQGEFGAVYRVKDERNPQKQLVLKEVTRVVGEERSGIPFDVAILKRLRHVALPVILRVFQSDNHDRFYILMDYVEGPNLEVVQQSMPGKRFSLPAAMTLISPIMDAVGYLHQQHPPLVHGDIKPSNIIVINTGIPAPTVLVDFGGARNLPADSAARQRTLNYRAPEQYGRRSSRRTDVYALGATFYTLLTGTIPAAAPDRVARLAEGEPDPLLPMNRITPSVREAIAQVIQRALSISRHDRFATVEHFWEELWRVIYENSLETQPQDLTIILQAGERRIPGSEPDVSPSEAGNPASSAGGSEPAEVISAATLSGSSLLPVLSGEGDSSVEIFAQAGSVVRRRKKRSLPVKRNGFARKPRKRKPKKFFLVVLAFLLVLGIVLGVATAVDQIYNAKYQNDLAQAQVGIERLQTGLSLMRTLSNHPLDATSVAHAQQAFKAASTTFARLNTDLQSIPGAATLIPGYGARLSAALHVVPLAVNVALAGVAGSDALNVIISRFQDPLRATHGLTLADLAEVGKNLHQLEADLSLATTQVNALQPTDLQLDSRIGKAVAAFRGYLPTLRALLDTADQLLPALPALLGVSTPAYYLVEVLDSTELRPGGGFIKDYGFATLIGGRLSAAHIAAASLLDTAFTANGQTLSYPPAYRWFDLASKSWSLRDSNLDADFPTAARYAEQNYSREGGKVLLQGVMAITPTLIEHSLAITGPIVIPELHETITAQNLIDRIHYYELGPGYKGSGVISPNGPLSASRYFTELLAEHFLTRIRQLPPSVLPQLLQLLVSSLHTKDLQVYFNVSPAHIDGAIQPSTGDGFLVVDANISPDNANQFITDTLDDRMTIDDRGNVTHHSTIRYAWLVNGNVYGSPLYRDYVRIYVPPGSTLQQQQGWQPRGTSEAFGREVWAGFFTLSYGQTLTITLTWTEKGIVKKDTAGWHYQYLLQRQAGAQWKLNVQVTLPSCVVRKHISGGFVIHNGQITTLTQSQTEDMNLGIDFNC